MTTENASVEPLEELRFALAQSEAHPTPPALRGRVLDAAEGARRPGRSIDVGPPITPVEAFRRTTAALDEVLCQLDADQWARPVLRDLDIQGLIGHLIGVERQFQAALGMGPDPDAGIDTTTGQDDDDHVASTQADALAQAGRPTADTHRDWFAAVGRTLEYVGSLDPEALAAPMSLHRYTLPVAQMLVVRSFETWTHDEDIRRATGRPLSAPEASRLTLMTELAVSALPRGLTNAGLSRPGRTARIVLTGPGGGTWQAGLDRQFPGSTDVRIIADATSFCRLVANRLEPDEVGAEVSGDATLGREVLVGAAALALD
jgi:uncharacterized protein (TIGR03083 family)